MNFHHALNRRQMLLAAASASALALPTLRANAHAPWPARTVRIVAAGPAGGSADLIARVAADALARETGQTFIVDARPGAGGVLAVNELNLAPPDGHTLLVAVNSLVSEIPHIVKTRLDMGREIAPVTELARGGLVLVGTPTLAPRTLAELIAYAKGRPGQINYASYSAGTLSHVLGLLLNQAAGTQLTHVGYKGSSPALADVMGGHVPLMFDGVPTSLPLLKAGKLKAYAISTPQRSALLPDVPTFTEAGFPQLEAAAWLGLWCKPAVPQAVQVRLREATMNAMAVPAVRERLQQAGFEAGTSDTQEQMAQGLKADFDRVGAVLQSIGFKPE